MINMQEALVPLRDVPRLIPGRPHLATIHRWVAKGVGGVKLERLRLGGRSFTSREALERFFEALSNREASVTVAQVPVRAPVRSTTEIELDRLGIR